MLKIFQRRPVPNSLVSFFLPLFYLLAAMTADHFIPGPPTTPALCTLALLFMALILPTPWMVLWSIIYTVVVVLLFHSPSLYNYTAHTRELPFEAVLDIRAFTFFCVGIFATTFSYLLNKHRKSLTEMEEIITRFPKPIVISDLSGSIVNCNNKVVEQLGISKETLLGLSYFDYFSPQDYKGGTIAKYLVLFEGHAKVSEFKLSLGKQSYLGETLILESSGKRLLLTVFKNPSLPNNDERVVALSGVTGLP